MDPGQRTNDEPRVQRRVWYSRMHPNSALYILRHHAHFSAKAHEYRAEICESRRRETALRTYETGLSVVALFHATKTLFLSTYSPYLRQKFASLPNVAIFTLCLVASFVYLSRERKSARYKAVAIEHVEAQRRWTRLFDRSTELVNKIAVTPEFTFEEFDVMLHQMSLSSDILEKMFPAPQTSDFDYVRECVLGKAFIEQDLATWKALYASPPSA